MTDVEAVITAMQATQEQVAFGQAVAVAVGGAGRWIDPHYWSDGVQREAFEQLVAEACAADDDPVVVFVTPVLVSEGQECLNFRNPREELRTGERLELFGLAIDAFNGFDVLRCSITTLVDESMMFGDIEIYQGQLRLSPETPGFRLMQGLLAA